MVGNKHNNKIFLYLLDDYESHFTPPKISHVSGNASAVDDTYSNDAMSSSEHDMQIWDDDHANNTDEESLVKIKKEVVSCCLQLFSSTNPVFSTKTMTTNKATIHSRTKATVAITRPRERVT